MSKDMLLAKGPCPDGWIDLALGDARCVREQLEGFLPDLWSRESSDLSYQPPEGWAPLRELLEEREGCRVVVTNGAKQGLAALLWAAARPPHGSSPYGGTPKNRAWSPPPYWCSFPPLAAMAGMEFGTAREPSKGNVAILASPSNPAGTFHGSDKAEWHGQMVVHDAAYWSLAYSGLCDRFHLPPCHYRVWSASKLLGLSSLRVGWIAFEDDAFGLYEGVREYVEGTTSGVSVASQELALGALWVAKRAPTVFARQLEGANSRMGMARKAFAEGLGGAGTVLNDAGMFAWCRKGPGYDPEAARVRVVDGAGFGDASCFRASMGDGDEAKAREAGRRLGEAARAKP